MPLGNFRLSEDQTTSEYVVVLADDGKTRAITRISREAIDDYVEGNLSQGDRVAIIECNLGALSELITAKYNAARVYNLYRPARNYRRQQQAHCNNFRRIATMQSAVIDTADFPQGDFIRL